jgi:hypothetical protein
MLLARIDRTTFLAVLTTMGIIEVDTLGGQHNTCGRGTGFSNCAVTKRTTKARHFRRASDHLIDLSRSN